MGNVKVEIEDILKRQVDTVNAEAFKSHPFLKQEDNSLYFKYDFFADIFRSIYITRYLKYSDDQHNLSSAFVDVVSENCWLGSTLNQDIVNRISDWNDNDDLLISDFIDQIFKPSKTKLDKAQKFCSNVFSLCLAIVHNIKSNSIENNTTLLKNVFQKSNSELKNICLNNISSEQKIKFDFSGLKIVDSYINNFNGFWDCTFDTKTTFIKCKFLNLKISRTNSLATKNNFIDCTYDTEFDRSLRLLDQSKTNKNEQMKSFLSDFFHLFLSNGRLGRQWEDQVILPRFNGINKYNVDYKKVIRILKKQNVLLVTVELGKNKFAIQDNYREQVSKFIMDGTMSKGILDIIKELSL